MYTDRFRLAAIADLHLTGSDDDADRMRGLFTSASGYASVLAICGDLTCHGRPSELRGLVEASAALEIPAVAVLGNHDHESDREEDLFDLLTSAGIDVLNGTSVVIDGIGFAGVKAFGGGFDGGVVQAFGEPALKRFVEARQLEVEKLERSLAELQTDTTVVLMHYSPVVGTLAGEAPSIWPFLGSSRFEETIDLAKPQAVFHGHAHFGAPVARTRSGIPVFNVAAPVLQREHRDLRIWTERRAMTWAGMATEPAADRLEL